MTMAADPSSLLTPLTPIATGVSPKLPKLGGIEVVAFDIYGTLLISAAGDISLADDSVSTESMERAISFLGARAEAIDCGLIASYYDEAIRDHRVRRRGEGINFPEVEIREVWRDIIDRAGIVGVSPADLESVAITYECGVNPVWLMPHLLEVMQWLREAKIPVGIVSNAQFYTQPILESLVGTSLQNLGFDDNFLEWSFQLKEGKPSQVLYERLAESCEARGIDSGSVFYVGNDLQKDILPARAVGFLTGLFAGDKRSLRIGGMPFDLAASLADAVITDLNQVREVVQLG